MKTYGIMQRATLLAAALALTACGGGGSGGTTSSGTGTGPTAAITTASSVIATANSQLQAGLGSQIQLSGSGSTDATSTISSYTWTLSAAPAGSTAKLSAGSGLAISFTPDVTGTYTVALTVTDAAGMQSAKTLDILVTSGVPSVSVVDNVQFNGPSTTEPTQNVDVGNIITLDASGSTDPNGSTLTISWLLQAPAGSKASLAVNGNVAHFSPDVTGQYSVRTRATNTSNAYSDDIHVFNVTNNAPTAIVAANATPTGGQGSISAATGYKVVLNDTSIAPIGDSLSNTWTLLSKPSGSTTAQLSASTGPAINFVPDAAGTYVVQLSETDTTTGLSNLYTLTINVAQAPTVVISGSSSPVALASGPTFVGQAGVPVTLRGSGSYDASGATLTYSWALSNKPANSKVILTNASAANLVFTPDVNGAYTFVLTVSDANGVSTSQPVTVDVGSYPPVAVVSQTQLGTNLGSTVTDSAANSYDQDGNALTYSWSVDAAPAGSTATIANPTSSTLTFTPDVAGTYTITVTVSDGNISSVATVTLSVMTATPGTVPLSYLPLNAKYSKGLDRAVIVATNPNSLHIVDPVGMADVSVALPAGVKSMSLSPNGQYAAVLHEGAVSLVNLSTGTLVNTSATGGSQTDAFVTNSGNIYLTGQTGGQWVTPGMTEINGATGATLQSTNLFAQVYGTTLGIYSDVNNKIFIESLGLSPAQIYAVSLNSSGTITGGTGSPYWGTYPMQTPFWLSGDQSLLFTAAGNYFKTSDLSYQGTFSLTGALLSLSNSATAQETVLLQNTASGLPAAYKRFTGSLQLPAADVPLPALGFAQSYGMYIFHASNDKHVLIVQTGTSTSNGVGAQYYLIER